MNIPKSKTCNYCYVWILSPRPNDPDKRDPYCPIWRVFLDTLPQLYTCAHWQKPPPGTPERDAYDEQVERERLGLD